jgi:hypothetical protein
MNKCRCDERLQTKTKEFTRLPYTGLVLPPEKKENEKQKQTGPVPSPANAPMSRAAEEIKDQLGVQLRCRAAGAGTVGFAHVPCVTLYLLLLHISFIH